MEVTVLHNQSLIDIALQTTGKAENFLQIAMANDVVPTEPIAPGTILTIPEELEKDEDIVRYYTANGIVPATELTETQSEGLELSFWEKVIKALNF
jgi:hypothetical protein